MPKSLEEAINEFEHSDFMKKVLGDHVFEKYIEAKKVECEAYRTQVSEWEINEYLFKIQITNYLIKYSHNQANYIY